MKWSVFATAIGLLNVGGPARAGLTLTAGASADGFKLTTFASGFPDSGTNGIGPIGIAFTKAGNILVSDTHNGVISSFSHDVDGQTYASASHVSGGYSYSADGMTTGLNGTVYLASYFRDAVYALNNDGTLNHLVANNLGHVDGIVTDPATGKLFVSSNKGVLIVDPTTGAVSTFSSKLTGVTDGLTFSADGKTLYAAVYGKSIEAVDVASGKLLFDVAVAGSDGTALGTGTLAGNIFANTNYGKLFEINLATLSTTLIASGGSRGDFVTVDPNGSLLITQTDSVLRLTAPTGGSFGAVPEPSSVVLTLLALPMAFAADRWRRRKRSA